MNNLFGKYTIITIIKMMKNKRSFELYTLFKYLVSSILLLDSAWNSQFISHFLFVYLEICGYYYTSIYWLHKSPNAL